jgi:hypothetical protein
MVEELRKAGHRDTEDVRRRSTFGHSVSAAPALIRRQWKATVVVAMLVVGASWVLGSPINNPTATSKAGAVQSHQTTTTTSSVVAPVVTTTSSLVAPAVTTTSTSAVTTPLTTPRATTPAPTPVVIVVAAPSTAPSVAALVSEVEASGIEPGSNWSWSMGDTATHCGAIIGDGTGCTYGSGGLEYSVFAGTPTLALVAHELANAETQNDAVPSLLGQVAAAAGGSTWSPTDGVASCLVAHFMGFQDLVAGSWQCPAALASTVAANIHESP